MAPVRLDPNLHERDQHHSALQGRGLKGPGLQIVDLGVGQCLQPFEQCWDLQRRLHALRVADHVGDTVLLTEHQSVYTAGKRTNPSELPADSSTVVRVDRGGRLTWHGPGQIVGYPIVRLPEPLDVVAYVRTLEQLLIDLCAAWGVQGYRIPGRSGVWVDRAAPRKLAAVGVRVAQGVSLHGFALNVDCDLRAYEAIIPCGITDAGLTCLSQEVGHPLTPREVMPTLTEQLERHLSPSRSQTPKPNKERACA